MKNMYKIKILIEKLELTFNNLNVIGAIILLNKIMMKCSTNSYLLL